MKKILVAVDGSESCSKAAEKAKDFAMLCKASVTFLTILESSFKFIKSKEEFDELQQQKEVEKQESSKFLDKCSKIYQSCESDLKNSGIEVNRVVKEGNYPAKDISDYADENGFDLIVMAAKGESNVKKFLLGSTTEKVVRHSKTSVLVIK